MSRDLQQAVWELCRALPEAEQFQSHGAPNFRLRGGKVYAIYALNHHHDGRVALWLNAAPGAQQRWIEADPTQYFVPPYVGPKGWLGVHLDRGLAWTEIAQRVLEAWQQVAPKRLQPTAQTAPDTPPPDHGLSPAQIDPLLDPGIGEAIERVRQLCLALPEVNEQLHYGGPSWYAGKRRFAGIDGHDGSARLSVKLGPEQQALMVEDPRFAIPPYIGPQGWIGCALSMDLDWTEIDGLLQMAYRQVANQRMLRALDRDGI